MFTTVTTVHHHLSWGKSSASRSPENVVDEIEELIDQYQINDIGFMDDTFMLNKRRANDIADEIKARDLDLSFVASSRVDSVDQSLTTKPEKFRIKNYILRCRIRVTAYIGPYEKGYNTQTSRRRS